MSEEKLTGRYFIVNKHGIIFECDAEHMQARLQQVGFRAPTPDELKEYLMRLDAGKKRRLAGDKKRPFMQSHRDPIAEPFRFDPDEAMNAVNEAISKAEKYMPKVVNASDGAIQFASEMGVDLGEVLGSGANGKITKSDVLAFIDAEAEAQDEADVEVENDEQELPE